MGAAKWFRQTTWNAKAEEAFFAKLARTRASAKRASYLRIQGLTLIETGRAGLVRTGMRLTKQVLAEYPGERGEIANCWCTLGEAHERLGENDEAMACYRSAWKYEKKWPHCQTDAPLRLALLVVKLGRRGDANEAMRAVDSPESKGDETLFPVVAMQAALVRAAVASWRGKRAAARAFAEEGLKAASLARSPLSRHPGLGLVGGKHKAEVAMLKRLAKRY